MINKYDCQYKGQKNKPLGSKYRSAERSEVHRGYSVRKLMPAEIDELIAHVEWVRAGRPPTMRRVARG